MSERHYADWCKAKLGLSKEFEEGFNKGYEYAKATIKPEIVKEYVQDPVTVKHSATGDGHIISKEHPELQWSQDLTRLEARSDVTTVANLEQYNSTQFAGLMQPGQRSNLNDYIDQQNIAQQTDR